jgi:hypothetical protein
MPTDLQASSAVLLAVVLRSDLVAADNGYDEVRMLID